MSTDADYEPSEQIFCTLVVCLGSFIAGYTITWSSPASRILTNVKYSPPFLVTSDSQVFWIFLWVPIGATLGALQAGLVADLFGRKLILLLSTVICTAVWIVTMLAEAIFIVQFTRFIMGMVVGIYSVVIPIYVIEIAEDSTRGRLGAYIYMFFSLGVLLVLIVGILNSYFVLCFVITILAVIFLFSQLFIPESPSYLVRSNRKEEALGSLRRIRNPHDNVELEMEELQIYLQNVTHADYSFWKIFTKVNVKTFFIAVILMIFHQVSAISIEVILSNAGRSSESCCIIILASIQSLFALITCFLVDRIGRKILLGISAMVTSLCLFAMGFYFWTTQWYEESTLRWLLLASLMTYVAAFSIGLGPLPWLLAAEILAPPIQPFGMALAASSTWLCFSLLSCLFQSLQRMSDLSYLFWTFAAVCFTAFIFIIFIVVETKGKSLQQIHDRLIGVQSNRSNIPK